MPWQMFNNNPTGRTGIGDCAVRAVSIALGMDWEQAYSLLAAMGFAMGDMPSSNNVWGAVLRQHGFSRAALNENCPDCYSAEVFCAEHPQGLYVLGFGTHVATVIDGVIQDSWNSGNEYPQYFWYKKE